MASLKLVPASSLGAVTVTAISGSHLSGVTLEERSAVSLCSVVARKGADNQLADRVKNGF